jgi:hypothetical protein
MKRIVIGLSIGFLVSLIGCVEARAQATAQISGTVRDQSGAVLPGVEVNATQTATGVVRSTVTNETGTYVLPNLALGPYRLEATLPGFRTYVQTGIVLQVDSGPVINPVLEVGQVTEQIEVQANAVMVETQSTSVGQVIENERILELPLNGRQATDLITLAGAAVQTNANGTFSMRGAVEVSVAGGLPSGVAYALDGTMFNNPFEGANLPLPFPDALQEFKVEASGRFAASGTRSGGAVNVVTKSGTNEFHGSAFEFNRNYLFKARDYFAPKRDSLKRNQFGGTLGGPIVQNKLFFFGGYQGTITRSDPATEISFVPTAAMLAGDFSTVASAACNARGAIALRAPFDSNNRVDPALFNRSALTIAAKLPKPHDECGRITWGAVQKEDESQIVGKIDYQLSANNSLFGRVLFTTYYFPAPATFDDNLLSTTVKGKDDLAQSYTIGHTYLFGPNLVNAFRMAVNRDALHFTHDTGFSARDVGVDAWSSDPKAMQVSVTGGFSYGNYPGIYRTTSYQILDDVNVIRGNHQMGFGGSLAAWRHIQRSHLRSVGTFSFNGQATGLGLGDFLLGRLSQLQQGVQTAWSSQQWSVGAYASDMWKATPKLTVTYGLRWEPFLPLRLKEGSVYNFNYDRFRQGIKSTVYPTAPAGLYFPGDPGFPEDAAVNKSWMGLAPRVGFAWDPYGDGRMSVRASYGISYDMNTASTLGNSAGAPPTQYRLTLTNPVGGFSNPYQDFPGGNPFPWSFDRNNPIFPQFAEFLPASKHDMDRPSVQQWNLSIQRQIGTDWLASAAYLGSLTTHIWIQRSLNPAIYLGLSPCTIGGVSYTTCSTTQNTNQRRKLFLEDRVQGGFYAAIDALDDSGTANYHGMLLSVQRTARGLNISGNYTWSHCIGDPWNLLNAQINPRNGLVDPENRRFDRGNCNSDRRHALNLTTVARTPQFDNPTLRTLATGWSLSGIYKISSGEYLTVTSGQDRSLRDAPSFQPGQQVLENPYGDRSSLTNYLNPAAFALPALGTLGNVGRNSIEGPARWQFDMALSREFRIREAQRLDLRIEAFNVTNSLIRGNPNTNLSQPNVFGQINTSREARVMQFALKYVF